MLIAFLQIIANCQSINHFKGRFIVELGLFEYELGLFEYGETSQMGLFEYDGFPTGNPTCHNVLFT